MDSVKQTEQVGVAVTLYIYIREVLGSNLSYLTEASRGVRQFLQANPRILRRFGHDHLLPHKQNKTPWP
jgi:hypothetical protein